jgi:hypothetical protein
MAALNRMLMILLYGVGYVLPAPCLVWGWLRFAKSRPRFSAPVWRRIAALSGLVVASVDGLSAVYVFIHLRTITNFFGAFGFGLDALYFGLASSALAVILSLLGKGPARLPALLASLCLVAYWFMP